MLAAADTSSHHLCAAAPHPGTCWPDEAEICMATSALQDVRLRLPPLCWPFLWGFLLASQWEESTNLLCQLGDGDGGGDPGWKHSRVPAGPHCAPANPPGAARGRGVGAAALARMSCESVVPAHVAGHHTRCAVLAFGSSAGFERK